MIYGLFEFFGDCVIGVVFFGVVLLVFCVVLSLSVFMLKFCWEFIVIVGIGCCFLGGVFLLEEFWIFLNIKGNGICEILLDCWSIDGFYDFDFVVIVCVSIKWGGFFENVCVFDMEFFDIFLCEVSSMDF